MTSPRILRDALACSRWLSSDFHEINATSPDKHCMPTVSRPVERKLKIYVNVEDEAVIGLQFRLVALESPLATNGCPTTSSTRVSPASAAALVMLLRSMCPLPRFRRTCKPSGASTIAHAPQNSMVANSVSIRDNRTVSLVILKSCCVQVCPSGTISAAIASADVSFAVSGEAPAHPVASRKSGQ